MLPAKHTYWFEQLFSIYLRYAFYRHFHAIEIKGTFEDKQLPLLVIPNHISWWDGFWIFRLNKRVLHRRLYLMMLEEQLHKYGFLRRLGAFSIDPGNRSMLKSIDYAADVLRSPANLLTIYPQGVFSSLYATEQKFMRGWERIIKKTNHPVQVLFVVHMFDYFSNPKPTLVQYIYSPEATTGLSGALLEEMYNDFYSRCLEQQKQRV